MNLAGLTPNAITAANLTFFQDNAGEYGNGSVALLRIYDSALNASQVAAAWNNGDPFPAAAVPEPASLSLAIVGGLVVLVRARGRRSLG